ncbi:MAG: DUF4388 domain-containing protein [Myxococcota bacterium]
MELERIGRDELSEQRLGALRRWVGSWDDVPDRPQRELARRILADIKACVLDPERTPDRELWRTLSTDGEILPDPHRVLKGRALLEEFAQSEDDELDRLLATLGGDDELEGNEGTPDDALGTLREPLVRAGQGEPTQVLMKGDLQAGLLTDVIQMFAQNNETGRLSVLSEAGAGAVFFDEGRIVDAIYGHEEGEAAFYRVMQLTRGRFSYERGIQSNEARIRCSVQHLILDALRVMDESTR